MKINVTENKVSIKEEQILNENEYNIHKIQFDFSSEYTDDLVKIALFSIDNHTYKKIISNNECDIPPEVLTQRGYSILGVYAYKTEQDTLVLRYSPSPTRISVYDGSYKAEAENSEPITPSEIEQYQQILQNSLQQFQNQYNALVEETEGDIQAIEDELQRKVDEGYFDGEDGFSPIAKVTRLSNGVKIEIKDKTGETSANVFDGYTPQRGVDYWTQEDKEEVIEESTQEIDGKIEEYNENAAEKLNQYNQNSVQKTNDYNTNAEQKMSAYNTNATEKTSTYNSNATEKFNDYNSNAEQKETNYNTNASSKLSEYNSNAETKKSAYDENATQKTNSFNTNATNKLTEYNTNHTEKMSAYNSNNTEKLNAFNENAVQKTEDFDEHTEEIQDNIEKLQTENARFKATLPTTGEVTGQDITLDKTAELEFKKPPLPMGNSEQFSTTGRNLWINEIENGEKVENVTVTRNADGSLTFNGTATGIATFYFVKSHSTGKYLEENQTYTLSGTKNINTSLSNACVIGGIGNSSTNDVRILTLSSTREITKDNSFIRFNEGTVLSNYTIKPFIEIGTTQGEYEPYTNGASPNPDYPQEITNVTGDVEVKVQNKNLFDGSKEVNTNFTNSVATALNHFIQTGEYATGYCNNSNQISAYAGVYETCFVPISENTNYHISSQASENNGFSSINILDKNGNLLQSSNNWVGAGYAFTTPSNAKYLMFGTRIVNIDYIQLIKGTTSIPLVPHKEQTFIFPLGNEKLMLGDYLADDGIHHVRGQATESGTTITLNDAKSGGAYLCNKKTSGNLVGKTLTFDEAITDALIEYELEEEVIVPYTSAQQEVYNQIKRAISYEEQTNISSNTIALFNVEAYQDAKVILAEKGTYSKPSTGIPKTDLASAVQTSLGKADTAIQEHQDISGKQDITDNTLTTINKTVPTAINEVNSIAKLANQAKSYSTYQAFINYLNTAEKTEFIPGQSFMIQTKLVPDLWVYSVENTSVQYTYTTDEDFITYTNQATGGQVGYYKLAQLETQKVDLTDYATKTYVNNLFNSIVDGDEVSY